MSILPFNGNNNANNEHFLVTFKHDLIGNMGIKATPLTTQKVQKATRLGIPEVLFY